MKNGMGVFFMGSKNDLKKVLPIVLAASGVLAGATENGAKLWSKTFQAENIQPCRIPQS